jgi:hypothetical protein
MLKQMLVDGEGSMDMPLRTQLKVDRQQDQIILVGHKTIKQVRWLKTLIGLCPATKYNAHHCKCKSDDNLWKNIQKITKK